MPKKISYIILIFLFLFPFSIGAETVEVTQPVRPPRTTVPATQPVLSSLPALDEEIIREAAAYQQNIFQPQLLDPLSSVNNFFDYNFFNLSGLEELTRIIPMMNPVTFPYSLAFAPFPATSALYGNEPLSRQAHYSSEYQVMPFPFSFEPNFFIPFEQSFFPMAPSFPSGSYTQSIPYPPQPNLNYNNNFNYNNAFAPLNTYQIPSWAVPAPVNYSFQGQGWNPINIPFIPQFNSSFFFPSYPSFAMPGPATFSLPPAAFPFPPPMPPIG